MKFKNRKNIILTGFGSSLEMFVLDKSDVWNLVLILLPTQIFKFELLSEVWSLDLTGFVGFQEMLFVGKSDKRNLGLILLTTRFASLRKFVCSLDLTGFRGLYGDRDCR